MLIQPLVPLYETATQSPELPSITETFCPSATTVMIDALELAPDRRRTPSPFVPDTVAASPETSDEFDDVPVPPEDDPPPLDEPPPDELLLTY